jgi:hypothetical protein
VTITGQDDFVIGTSGFVTADSSTSLASGSDFEWDSLDKLRFTGFTGSYFDDSLDYLVGRGAINVSGQTYSDFDALHDEVKRVADQVLANFSDSSFAVISTPSGFDVVSGNDYDGGGAFVIYDGNHNNQYDRGLDQIVYLKNYVPGNDDWDRLFYIPPTGPI